MKNKNKRINKKNNNDKYNAENEIIIGVTTKPKEKVRVAKKTTRTNKKNVKNKNKINAKISKKNTGESKRTEVKIKEQNEKYIKKINKKKIIVSIVIVLCIALGGIIYYLTTPVFNVTSIIINGNSKNSTDTYISLSRIIIGETNIFAFTENSIRNNLKENSYVEDIELTRKLPNTIEINVTERQVDFQTEYADKYIYLDKQGYILEINEENKEVTIVNGLETIKQDIKVGQRLNNDDLMKLDTVIKIVNYCKYNSLEDKITSIDATDVSNYVLTFEEEGKKAYIGDSTNLTEKMTVVSKILSNEKGKKGEIFADEDALKRNRVYFREEE